MPESTHVTHTAVRSRSDLLLLPMSTSNRKSWYGAMGEHKGKCLPVKLGQNKKGDELRSEVTKMAIKRR